MKTVRIRGAIDLDAALSMGQSFCWQKRGEWHFGTIGGHLMRVQTRENGSLLAVDPPNGRVERYFDVERDMRAVQREIARRCLIAGKAAERFPQVRMLRQPFWECLAGFLLSSVNNIKRIARIVENLSQAFGADAFVGGRSERAFPSADALAVASIERLYELGTGFRARGLREAAEAVSRGGLAVKPLRSAPLEEARRTLMELRGVGPKIADCVLLYGLDRPEAFPLDVWMLREMRRLYFNGESRSADEIQAFARGRFGELAGYAQLYLYHSARMDGMDDSRAGG